MKPTKEQVQKWIRITQLMHAFGELPADQAAQLEAAPDWQWETFTCTKAEALVACTKLADEIGNYDAAEMANEAFRAKYANTDQGTEIMTVSQVITALQSCDPDAFVAVHIDPDPCPRVLVCTRVKQFRELIPDIAGGQLIHRPLVALETEYYTL